MTPPGVAVPRGWPALPLDELGGTTDYLRRIVQVGAKYTLSQPFEPSWGNIVLNVTGRGLVTPTLRVGNVTFTVHYRLLDNDVVIEASTGSAGVLLTDGAVSSFYDDFTAAAATLSIPPPGSVIAAEIPGAAPLNADHEPRTWDTAAATDIWQAFDAAADALGGWQAPYRAYRPRVGVMWGGFDLSATRYRAVAMDPPAGRPVFQQNGMAEEVVALGFALPDKETPDACFYGYIAPEPPGIADWNWAPEQASWQPEAGLAVLPWDAARRTEDPAYCGYLVRRRRLRCRSQPGRLARTPGRHPR